MGETQNKGNERKKKIRITENLKFSKARIDDILKSHHVQEVSKKTERP